MNSKFHLELTLCFPSGRRRRFHFWFDSLMELTRHIDIFYDYQRSLNKDVDIRFFINEKHFENEENN